MNFRGRVIILERYICKTCGVQYENSFGKPEECIICGEERQFISSNVQNWTTLESMIKEGIYKNTINIEEEGLYSINTSPVLELVKQPITYKTRILIYCGIVFLI